MGNEHGKAGGSVTPAGIQSMDENLQRKFSKGIQFNMKIVLKGDRNTGKTCLFHRMGGKGFMEAYLPTSEIQVTSILWSYKVTSDTVKVEVWDVVDKGRVQRKDSKGGLKIFNTSPDGEDEEEGGERGKVLDAMFLDVYKGCNGVVLMFDMTKIWTWKYVERELPKVPYDIPVMILANFRDMGDHRAITKDEALAFVESLNRPDGSSEVMYAECSMKNAFGLTHLHKFLNIPFLQLQQDMLLQQIQVSREQMMAARDELASASNTEDQNYDMFSARLQRAVEERRKIHQQQQEAQENGESSTATTRRHTMDSEQGSIRSSSSTSSAHPPVQATSTPKTPPFSNVAERRGSGSGKKRSVMSRLFSKSKEKSPEPSKGPTPSSSRENTREAGIDDFVPDGSGEVNKFLDDEGVEEGDEVDVGGSEDSEEGSSEDDANPAVTRDEDLSSAEDDDTHPSPPKPVLLEPSPVVKQDKPVRPLVQLKSAKEIELTESEEEEEEEEGEDEEQTVPRSTTTNKQKDLEIFWGKVEESTNRGRRGGEGEEGESGAGKSKPKAKSGGLLLEWAVPEPTKASEKKKESPDLSAERREKRKKSKKSSKRREREADTNETSVSSGAAAVSDPFRVNSSLDAWLNSEDILQPTAVSQGGEEVGQEVGEGESEETGRKKSKKHHHKHRRSLDGARKKKHKSHHSSKDREEDNVL